MDHSVNLFNRYEQVLFAQQAATRPVSCVIITGFLGSGKTTLVNYLLRHKSDLRLAVLVNEVGAIDIDGQLVSLQQTNAAVGVVSRQLAGGCACCEVIGDLRGAAKELLSANWDLDYLVLETSGAADVEPMVEVMREAGLQVDGVVAVVDAEAALQQLESGIAVQQVHAADLVVLNKCDLASLGQVAHAEDRIHTLAPSTAVVRARHGQVDPALLFVPPATGQDAPVPASNGSLPNHATPPPSVAGQVAFMSHESAPVLRPAGTALAAAGLQSRRTQTSTSTMEDSNPAAATASHNDFTPSTQTRQDQALAAGHVFDSQQQQQQKQQQHTHHDRTSRHQQSHHDHLHHHQAHHVVTRSFMADCPLSLAWFQRFVVEELLPTPGLLRVKGLLWFLEELGSRFTFHLSGRRRVECHTSEAWSCPPSCQLVLIGQGAADLERLCGLLEAAGHGAGRGPCVSVTCSIYAAGPQTAAAAVSSNAALPLPGMTAASRATADSSTGEVRAAIQEGAATLRQLISQHPRFAVVDHQQRTVSSNTSSCVPAATEEGNGADAHSSCSSVVEFTVVGSPLHGVFPEAVNADVLVKVNGCGQLLLSSRKAAGTISSTSLRQSPFRCMGLMLAVEDAAGARSAWRLVQDLSAAVLRKAFAHVHNCGCDVHVGPM